MTVIAEKFLGKRLNSPNDIVVHPTADLVPDPLRHPRQHEGFKSRQEVKEAVYRVDGKRDRSTRSWTTWASRTASAFPDYKKVCRHRRAARDQGVDPTENRCATASGSSSWISRDECPLRADGIRCDADGNIWPGRPGVQIVTPAGERIGMIRLPETCANVLRRPAPQPPVHGREPVALRRLRRTVGAHIV